MANPALTADDADPKSVDGRSAPNARFDRAEWEVIVLAQCDGLESLQPPGSVAKLFSWMFGGGPNKQLANPRLETLRRLAVHAWRTGYSVPKAIVEDAVEAGFSAAQIDAMLASITGNLCKSKLLNPRRSLEVGCPKLRARLMHEQEAALGA